MKLFDYLYSEEGMLLMNFGVEGEQFEYVDGEIKYTDLIMNNPDGLVPAGCAAFLRRTDFADSTPRCPL